MPYLRAVDQPLGSTRTLLTESRDGGRADVPVSTVRRTVLPGGLRVITDRMAGARSVTVGLWSGVGSRDEPPRLAGATHFLEHLLFKGTARRTALDISAALDSVGGELNAFTGKEYTCYHARVLEPDLPLAVDVLCDMVTSASVPAAEVESERAVIVEEMAMHDDDPEDLVADAFVSALYGDGGLGRPITGSLDTVTAMSRRQIVGHYGRHYRAENLVFAAAGDVDHRRVVRLVEAAFRAAGALGAPERGPSPVRAAGRPVPTNRATVSLERPTEAASFVLGGPALARDDPRRFALGVLNAVLGGGPSSRLFQQVREQRGLAYSVCSYTTQFVDTGYFAVAASCLPAKLGQVLDISRDELAKVAASGVTLEEVQRGKGQLRGALVMGLEDSAARMSRIGKSELLPGGLMSVDEAVARIDAVTAEDVHEIAQTVLPLEPTLAVVGPRRALAKLG